MTGVVLARPRLDKALLATRIWGVYLRVRWRLPREPLPDLVRELSAPGRRPSEIPARRLSRAVDRSLGAVGLRPRCLVKALVLYRLLRTDGQPAELVIGLLPDAPDHRAHAWVELQGADVGPPPGRGRHVPMARYP